MLYSREAWEAVIPHLDGTEFSAHGEALFAEIDIYYGSDIKATAVDKGVICDRVVRKMPKQASAFTELLKEMSAGVGSTNVVREVLEVKRLAKAEELMVLLAQQGEPSATSLALEEYTKLNDATDILDAGGTVPVLETSFADLARKSQDKEQLIKLLPRGLNVALRGGMLPGQTLIIFGRVNVGKSAYFINNLAGFLRQGKSVLLIENEDLVDDVKRRIGCRLVGRSLDWAENNPDEFGELCQQRGGDLLTIPDPVPNTTREIDAICAVQKPDVLIVNQLRHLAPDKAAATDNTGAVDRVSQQLRAIGKKRRVLTVLVGAALEGERDREGNVTEKPILEMSDSYGSRTGVPGAADVMIGVGNDAYNKARNVVALHLCKNKRGSAEPVIWCKVDLEQCKFQEI